MQQGVSPGDAKRSQVDKSASHPEVNCNCGVPARVLTSQSAKNPGRDFYKVRWGKLCVGARRLPCSARPAAYRHGRSSDTCASCATHTQCSTCDFFQFCDAPVGGLRPGEC